MLLAKASVGVGKFYMGQDLDLLCVKMAALNLCFFNLEGVILHGNSLKGEVLRGYRTSSSLLGGSIRDLSVEECNVWADKVRGTKPREVAEGALFI
jgi:hypothetical protein